ncbi:MAG: 4-hydroxybenzoate octaprenyltransferase [Desulfarculaceae bacterium]|jgi:4-hydroxybenzoate polyprenyltransferase
MQASIPRRVLDFGELVKFSHTVFLFPFALAAVILAHQVRPVTTAVMFWIVTALVSARSAAMVMNRIADRRFDALNPRTQGRPLVDGRVSPTWAWLYLLIASTVFFFASWRLGPLCLGLSPLALAWVLSYSYTKRFTDLCHLWLGVATALAPLGAWLAVAGAWDWRILVLVGAVALWVAGFDIIYACQDIDFDISHRLHSLPAGLGLGRALWASRILHAGSMLGFWLLKPLFGLGPAYVAGTGLMAVMLAWEQMLVAQKRANIPMAFFTLNGVVSILFLGTLAWDRFWGS